jgi:hypothetical protein
LLLRGRSLLLLLRGGTLRLLLRGGSLLLLLHRLLGDRRRGRRCRLLRRWTRRLAGLLADRGRCLGGRMRLARLLARGRRRQRGRSRWLRLLHARMGRRLLCRRRRRARRMRLLHRGTRRLALLLASRWLLLGGRWLLRGSGRLLLRCGMRGLRRRVLHGRMRGLRRRLLHGRALWRGGRLGPRRLLLLLLLLLLLGSRTRWLTGLLALLLSPRLLPLLLFPAGTLPLFATLLLGIRGIGARRRVLRDDDRVAIARHHMERQRQRNGGQNGADEEALFDVGLHRVSSSELMGERTPHGVISSVVMTNRCGMKVSRAWLACGRHGEIVSPVLECASSGA